MKTLREAIAVVVMAAVVMATSPASFAQEAAQAPLTAAEIDAIVSPIALYPDQLVAQILGAATYPDQVTAASNFVNSSGLKDNALVQAVDKQPWDPSVKALCPFPTVLDQMAKNLAWTSALGDAFFNQQGDVMASIQRLRKQAKDAGNLKTTNEIKVVQESPQTIVIQPANPQVVYVPTYNPTVVYGTPYYPPGYSTAALVTTGLISFGLGVAVGAMFNNSCCGWGWGYGGWGCNWGRGNVYYQNNVYISRSNTFYGNNRYVNNPYYRNPNRPTTYNSGNRNTVANNRAAWNSGNVNSGNTVNRGGNTVNRGGNTVNINGDVNVGNTNRGGNTANISNRQGNTTNAGNRTGNIASNNQGGNRPGNASGNAAASRPATAQAADRGFGQQPQRGGSNGAFGGYQQGGNARADANRGRQSTAQARPVATGGGHAGGAAAGQRKRP